MEYNSIPSEFVAVKAVRKYIGKVQTTVLLQGVRTQTVTSNLAMTDRKNTTNFNLIANYIQGRLGIYA